MSSKLPSLTTQASLRNPEHYTKLPEFNIPGMFYSNSLLFNLSINEVQKLNYQQLQGDTLRVIFVFQLINERYGEQRKLVDSMQTLIEFQ